MRSLMCNARSGTAVAPCSCQIAGQQGVELFGGMSKVSCSVIQPNSAFSRMAQVRTKITSLPLLGSG
jgi:hypothetical protein